MQQVLIVMRHSAWHDSQAREAQDLALAMAAMEHQVNILYLGEAVLQLLPLSGKLVGKDFTLAQKLFPLYDIGEIYVCATALHQYQLEPSMLRLPVTIVDDFGLAAQQQAQSLLVF
jgi:tRNA 2-thiouridine synthesizing protein C